MMAERAAMERSTPFTTSGSINFLGPMDHYPVFYSEKTDKTNLNLQAHTVDIVDYRDAPQAPSLEKEGFTLVQHPLDLRGQVGPQVIAELYFPSLIELIKQITGARKIFTTKPLVRWAGEPKHDRPVNSRPGRFAHSDFDHDSFYGWAHRFVGNDPEAGRWLGGRIAAFNIWRVLSPPPQDVPLAVMDRTSAKPSQVTSAVSFIDSPVQPITFTSSLWKFDESQRWGYFSRMTPNEALVFSAYDSADDAMPGPAHSAFDDPGCPKGVEPRSSCETRVFAFWG